ncbi:hypothetical protein SEEJ0720_16116 [Salmonella enterica subsp. enterica serovar Javiana str. PRS_2010_0720]|nr:hypothetical protein SEEJ0720_16116 [Salmonella enterica subsp. enterica serovar Javiana str. PRS_2010_0720]
MLIAYFIFKANDVNKVIFKLWNYKITFCSIEITFIFIYYHICC